jgi:hypothetical protein
MSAQPSTPGPGDGLAGGTPNGDRDLRASLRPYSVFVGIVFIGIVIAAGVHAITGSGPGVRGLHAGSRLPAFAAPSATGSVEGDANVCRSRAQAGCKQLTPACRVRGAGVIRICDYFDRPLVLVAWFTRCGNCARQLDTVERVRRRFSGVAFVGLDVLGSHEDARRLVREHGWRFPMAVDRSGDVGVLYDVIVGPTIYFAYPGGVVRGSAFGELDEHELAARVTRLARASRERRG